MNKGKIISTGIVIAGGVCVAIGVGDTIVNGLSHVFQSASGAVVAAKIGGAVLGGGLGFSAAVIKSITSKTFNPKNSSSMMMAFIMAGSGFIFGAVGGTDLGEMAARPRALQTTPAPVTVPADHTKSIS